MSSVFTKWCFWSNRKEALQEDDYASLKTGAFETLARVPRLILVVIRRSYDSEQSLKETGLRNRNWLRSDTRVDVTL